MSVSHNSNLGKPSPPLEIVVRGARVHNLKNLSVEIPLDRLTVLTGVSGCGKSSLAYDTIFAEGRRCYLECLSARTGQFLGSLEQAEVDSIENLPPPLSVAQHPGLVHPRSTVGTITEIHDYLRLLYSRTGLPHCPHCKTLITQRHAVEIVEQILTIETGRKAMLLAPLVRGKKGTHAELLRETAKSGFVRARIDGEIYDLANPPALSKSKLHTIEVVVDRIIIKEGIRERLQESVLLTLRLGNGNCLLSLQTDATPPHSSGWEDSLYSSRFVCSTCSQSTPEIEPRTFSFNSPYGACPTCTGTGTLPDRNQTDCINARCPDCHGERLSPVGRHVTITGVSLPELCRKNLTDVSRQLRTWITSHESNSAPATLDPSPADSFKPPLSIAGFKPGTAHIARQILERIADRIDYLQRVGLGYLSLDRPAPTLSGGEFQRVRLAECLGNRLSGACYILDEPTAGLHPLDTQQLLSVMRELRDQGNTLIVIEHDLSIIEQADHLIELGPGAGNQGGSLIAAGPPTAIQETPTSITGHFLQSHERQLTSRLRTTPSPEELRLSSASLHNLANLEVAIPLRRFVCITGVSGSGKSSLVSQTLIPLLKQAVQVNQPLHESRKGSHSTPPQIPEELQKLGRIAGAESLTRIVEVDQSPLGRNSRSCPATSSGIWNHIRRIFTTTRESRARGYNARRFSMVSPEGRCPECRGLGTKRISMEFLSDTEVLCPTCCGDRFNPETLSIRYRGLNLAEILRLKISDALDFFVNQERIHSLLRTFSEVGLDYLTLGQSARTLSGGESQRVKLATALSGEQFGHTLFFLDEPTTGLHVADTRRLIHLLQKLVDQNHSLIVIEHQADVIGAADWIIELGPGGGPSGGRIVEQDTPANLIRSGTGPTSQTLRTWTSFPSSHRANHS